MYHTIYVIPLPLYVFPIPLCITPLPYIYPPVCNWCMGVVLTARMWLFIYPDLHFSIYFTSCTVVFMGALGFWTQKVPTLGIDFVLTSRYPQASSKNFVRRIDRVRDQFITGSLN